MNFNLHRHIYLNNRVAETGPKKISKSVSQGSMLMKTWLKSLARPALLQFRVSKPRQSSTFSVLSRVLSSGCSTSGRDGILPTTEPSLSISRETSVSNPQLYVIFEVLEAMN